MSKFLDQTGLSHFWSKIKTLLAGKADKEELNGINELVNDFNTDISELYNTKADTDYVDTSCGGVYDLLYDEIDGVRNALVTCDATVGGLVDSVSDLEDNTEKMTNHYIGHPEGGEYQYLGTTTGAIFIKVPKLINGGSVSFDVNVTCGRFQSDATYRISGYMATAGWSNTGAMCLTSLQNQIEGVANNSIPLWNLLVKFGCQNGEYGVYIGELTSTFIQPVITISNVSVFAWAVPDTKDLRKNWEVSIVQSYPIPVASYIYNTQIYAPKRTDYTLDEIGMPKSSIKAPFTVQPFMSSTRANRLFALPTDQIIVEHSIDGGVTWTDAGYTDWTKAQIFSQTKLGLFQIPLKNGSKSCDCMLRVTITGMKYNVPEGTAETEKYNYWNSNYAASTERYCSLDFGYFWISANIENMYIEHQVATGANPNSWVSDGLLNKAQGWPGGNYVKFNGNVFGGGTNQIYNYWNHRFIFRTQATDGTFDDSKLNQSYLTTQQSIYEISCYGQNCWTAANEMMKNDRPYTVNVNKQVTFENTVISPKGFAIYGASDAANRLLKADGGTLHVDVYANRFATADHTHDGYASSTHTHKTFDDDITMNGDLYVENISVNSEIEADRIIEDGDYLANRYAAKTHTHDDYVTTTYLNSMRYVSEQDLSTQIQNTEGLIQDLDERVQVLEQASDSASSASCQFKIMTRKTLTTNGAVDLSSYIDNASYSELMIIVRTQATAAVTLGISNTTEAISSKFIASKSLSTGTSYTKIILSKTDEGYYMWDVNGSIGFSNDATYKYLRNYSATSGAVSSMSIVIHGR